MRWIALRDVQGDESTGYSEIENILQSHRIDPYLVWQQLNGLTQPLDGIDEVDLFRGRWPIVAELKQGVVATSQIWTKDIDVNQTSLLSSVYNQVLPNGNKASRYIATRVHVDRLPDLLKSLKKGDVVRFQLGLPRESTVSTNSTVAWATPAKVATLHFVGVVDDGLPFLHPDINPNGENVFFVWDQTGFESRIGGLKSNGVAPVNMAYGSEFVGLPNGRTKAPIKTAIDTAITTHPARYDREAYRLLGYQMQSGIRMHGVGVLHAAAGVGARRPLINGGAKLAAVPKDKLPVIAVQFPRTAANDTSGGWLGFHVLDGIRYIIDRAAAVAKQTEAKWDVVINVSFGGSAGPHDGTSMVELAIDELCTAYNDNVAVILGAGNTHGRRMHALNEVTKSKPGSFTVNVPPDKGSDTYVEFWLPTSLQGQLDLVELEIVSPSGDKHVLKAGNAAIWCPSQAKVGYGNTTAAAIFARRVAQGLNGTMVLLAVRPTAASRLRPRGSAGEWRVTVLLGKKVSGKHPVHAWIERDDRLSGAKRTQQAKFVVDRTGSVPDVSLPIRNPERMDKYTFNSLANGKMTFVAGALNASSRLSGATGGLNVDVPRYSSAGPTISASRIGPDISAVTDASISSPGLILSGTFAGQTTRMSGTSIAAPRLANGFSTLLANGVYTLTTLRKAVGKPPTPNAKTERVGAFWLP